MSASHGQAGIVVTALAVALTVGFPDGAASQVQDSLTLTLEDALQMAMQSNPGRRQRPTTWTSTGPKRATRGSVVWSRVST